MKIESGTTDNPKYQECVDRLPGWHLRIDDESIHLTEITSPSGNVFTSLELDYADELLQQGYDQDYIDQLVLESATADAIWDCINLRRYSDK